MSRFDLVRFALRALPLLFVPLLTVLLRRFDRLLRYVLVLAVGWLVLVVCTNLFWSLSIRLAPTGAIREDLASRDGGPRAFVLFFGWLYVAVYLAVLEGTRLLYRALSARHRGADAA